MPFDLQSWAPLISPLAVAIVAALLKKYLEGRPRLIAYLGHASAHPVPPENDGMPANTVHTHSIVVRNTGGKAANNVRIGHAIFPASYQIYPSVSHSILPGHGGSGEILLPTLVPYEQITVSYLYPKTLFWHQIDSYIKSDEGLANKISVIPNLPVPKSLTILVWSLIFVGATTCVYWALMLASNIAP